MAVLFRPKRPNQFGAMAGVGHEDQFRLRWQGVCYRFDQPTFAEMHSNGRDAPEAVFYARGRVGPDLPLTGCIEEFR